VIPNEKASGIHLSINKKKLLLPVYSFAVDTTNIKNCTSPNDF